MKRLIWTRKFALPVLIAAIAVTIAACGHISTTAPTQPKAPTQVSTQALDWQTQTVFDTPDTRDGMFTSIALDPYGNPHVAYVDWTAEPSTLLYASFDPTATPHWTSEEVATPGPDDDRGVSLAFDPDGNPHIAYEAYDDGAAYLKYASPDGGSPTGWSIEVVAEDVRFPSLAFDGSTPHISYQGHDSTTGAFFLAYASPDSSSSTGWTSEVAYQNETTLTDAGEFTSLAFDSDGNPHISSAEFPSGSYATARLTYTSYDPDASPEWSTVVVDDGSDDDYTAAGLYSSLALDSDDNPHIGYGALVPSVEVETFELKYAWYDGGWTREVIDDGSGTDYPSVGRYASLALDGNDDPHISYTAMNPTDFATVLKHAWYEDGEWQQPEVVDALASFEGLPVATGWFTSLAIDRTTGRAYISYQDMASGNLKIAIGTVAETVSPEEAIQSLIDDDILDGLVNVVPQILKPGQANGLTHPLENALRSVGKGNTDDACNQLEDFVTKVEAKTPAPLPTDEAATLINAANDIRDSLGCSY